MAALQITYLFQELIQLISSHLTLSQLISDRSTTETSKLSRPFDNIDKNMFKPETSIDSEEEWVEFQIYQPW